MLFRSRNLNSPEYDFLLKLIDVCRESNMSLGHEDSQGSFLVHPGFDFDNAVWLLSARVIKPGDNEAHNDTLKTSWDQL